MARCKVVFAARNSKRHSNNERSGIPAKVFPSAPTRKPGDYFFAFLTCQTMVSGSRPLTEVISPRSSIALIVLRLADAGTYHFAVFQAAQHRLPAARISLQLIAMLHVPQEVLFSLVIFAKTSGARFFIAIGKTCTAREPREYITDRSPKGRVRSEVLYSPHNPSKGETA